MGIGSTPVGSSIQQQSAPWSKATGQARYLDPYTGDYVITTDDTDLQRMPTVRQRVLLALITRRGSIAGNPNFGNPAWNIDRIDQRFETRLRNAIKLALYQLVEIEKAIRIERIGIEIKSGGRCIYTVEYIDLVTKDSDNLAIQHS